MYILTNTGTNGRIIFDRKNRAVSILPGETKENVDLDPNAARRIAATKEASLLIEQMDGFEVDEPPPIVTSVAASVPENADVERFAIRTPAQLLVAAADGMSYADFRREAARTLGDDWPGGRPQRTEIVAMLQKAMGL